jgi:hypothetical protein
MLGSESGVCLNMSARSLATSLLIIIAAASVSWQVLRSHVMGANVTATWAYDYTPLAACSQQVTVSCIDHFEVKDITDQQHMSLIQPVANPEHPVGKVDHISTSFKYGPPFGQREISVIAVGRDARGSPICSNPFAARQSVAIRPFVKASLLF